MKGDHEDEAVAEHRRRELDFMRELEEQSGTRPPAVDEPGMRAAPGEADDPPEARDPKGR